MTSLPTPQLLIELEALAFRLALADVLSLDDAILIRQAIRRIEQLSAYEKMAADK